MGEANTRRKTSSQIALSIVEIQWNLYNADTIGAI